MDDAELLHEVLGFLKANLEASTALIATTRGHRNNVLLAGMFSATPTAPFARSFSVPMAGVYYLDMNSLGLTISTGTGVETEGPGVIVPKAGDARCLPLLGDRIVVTPGAPGSFYVACFSVFPVVFFGGF
jgi:hypothetical protein